MTSKIVSINKRSSIYFNLFFSPLIFFICAFYFSIGFAKAPPESFADLSDQVSSSVVNIASTVTSENAPLNEFPQFPPGSPFEEFFKDFMDKGPSRRPSQSLGSGFIISKEGLIVTNNHVIEGAEEITILLSDDREFNAKLIGRDTKTDIAVLKIESEGETFPFVEFGDSEILRVGDWVLAVGNPFGLGGSVTAGIVSARGREIGQGQYDDFIQTDASINRGNSGGPLFNMDGKVIGINTAIFSQSGGSVGIGFAIASNLASSVVDQLIEFGRTRRGWLGVYIQEVTEEIAESLEFTEARGALVSSVSPGSPAEKAKLLSGDIVLSFDGKKINKMRELPRIVAETKVGSKVDIDVWREGKPIKLTVILGELEEKGQIELSQNNEQESLDNDVKKVDILGLEISNITPDLALKFDIDESIGKVVITEVETNGPSFNKGINVGNVIRRAGRQDVNNVDDVLKALNIAKERGSQAFLLLITDGERERFVAINISKLK